ncbi:hypothetical protein TNCV_906201 [Trichonephila clavipes]|nr:hypothetical protein TNCV_906201 [Trichonephila clavipes]
MNMVKGSNRALIILPIIFGRYGKLSLKKSSKGNRPRRPSQSEKDKALLVKLFFTNKESATAALRLFQLQKNGKTEKEPSTVIRLIKLVQRFEGTGSLEDRVRSVRPSLKIISKRCAIETSRNITARVIEYDTSREIYYFLEDSRGFRARQHGRQ